MLIELHMLAEMAKPAQTGDPRNPTDWGSERQIEAENAFFEFMEDCFPEVMTDDFEAYCLKATTEEMIAEAVIRAEKIEAKRERLVYSPDMSDEQYNEYLKIMINTK